MKRPVLAILLLFFLAEAQAQSLSELQQRRQSAAREIEMTNRLLNQVQQQEKASLNRLQLISNTINQRNKLISSLNSEIRLYQEFIQNNNLSVQMLSDDLEKMKTEYAKLIRMTYLGRTPSGQLFFLFSAESFNQAYRRLLYMRRYTAYRNNQAELMKTLQQLLNEKAEDLEKLKSTRQQLLDEARNETEKLAQEKSKQNREVQDLKHRQQDLKSKLQQQRSVEQQLEREIQRIIEEEARKKRDAGEPAYALTPEQKLVGDSFAQNKLKLPWPVERGVITERFGIHRHPVLENVQVRNNGINIATETNAGVRAVFNGEVSRVFGISGGNSAVIIRHGNYLTVYSNLKEVIVKKGDKVSVHQKIGTVYTDADDGNKSILKFQIWRENQKLNPEEWISR
ncbi:MAG: peptidoglycan DD-metalloendopeptidase family protein [Bacteroidales bacterium]|nr:peptidoglycan DD-metalloendopeptidase family protein [Bacteroidales bacterium]